MVTMSLIETKATIDNCIALGIVDGRVISALITDNQFLPKECELWDYKREVSSDAAQMAKLVLRVVSFFNTHGGYLIFGVEEQRRDQLFIPRGIQRDSINAAQLRSLLQAYTGDAIDTTYLEVQHRVADKDFLFGVLHIPKRPGSMAPCRFGKNGPDDKPGSPVFRRGDVYFRRLDECVALDSKEDWKLLLGDRDCQFVLTPRLPHMINPHDSILEHNLPDRNVVCPRFIGRSEEIENLWKWLGDPFAYCRLLAGDGGKGKTSIAYAFAEEVCRSRPYGFGQVIWLTAKTKQFNAYLNHYLATTDVHFSDLHTLLVALCQQVAVLDTEIDGASVDLLKKQLTFALSELPCLVIIDDIDSVQESDEQRRIFEVASQLASVSRARFLLTTRMNLAYSSEACTVVAGLNDEDYRTYVLYLSEKYAIPPISPLNMDRLRVASDGSPLFTESIVSLIKSGLTIKEALKSWTGKLGEEVRMAALLREIHRLSPEARRVLYACSLMEQASLTELRQVTSYDETRMGICIVDLQSLFLLNAPKLIRKEPRFQVSSNTRNLVLEKGPSVVVDPGVIRKAVERLRTQTVKSTAGQIAVGAAIGQSLALMRANRHRDATATIEAALKLRDDDLDLLLALARCQSAEARVDNDVRLNNRARVLFLRIYELGQRKDVLYEAWYFSEIWAEHWIGAAEVAYRAITNQVVQADMWRMKRAESLLLVARAQNEADNQAEAKTTLSTCLEDVVIANRIVSGFRQQRAKRLLEEINDYRWQLVVKTAADQESWIEAFDVAKSSILSDDLRRESYEHLVTAVEAYASKIGRREFSDTESHAKLAEITVDTEHLLVRAKAQSGTLYSQWMRRLGRVTGLNP